VVEAFKSMIIHVGESSDHMSTDEEEFWSSSEDKQMGEMVQISSCYLFNFLFKQPVLYIFVNNVVNTQISILVFFYELIICKCLLGFLNPTFSFIAVTKFNV
jgi:hypothetical protein